MAGRPRKPTKLKVISGTVQPCRENKNAGAEFAPLSEIPDAPDWLPIDGVTEFERLAQILHNQKLLTDACLMPLAVLCGTYAKIVQQFKAGTMPTASQITQYRLLCVEFGLTPVSQGKVNAGALDDKKANKFAKNGQRPGKVG